MNTILTACHQKSCTSSDNVAKETSAKEGDLVYIPYNLESE